MKDWLPALVIVLALGIAFFAIPARAAQGSASRPVMPATVAACPAPDLEAGR